MGAIVKVDKRHYRRIAQENWGLTTKQMVGMHVHHRTPRPQGGTNDASNLYVCSPYFHAYVWHSESYFTECSRTGGGANTLKQQEGRVRRGKEFAKNGQMAKMTQISLAYVRKPTEALNNESGTTHSFGSVGELATFLGLSGGYVTNILKGHRPQRKDFTIRYIK